MIMENSNDPKGMFRTLDYVLNRKSPLPLPPSSSDYKLANDFVYFFHNRVKNIHKQLIAELQSSGLTREKEYPGYTTELTVFRSLSQDEVKKLILKSPTKSCSLDPIPTWLLKLCLEELLPAVITEIVNMSFEAGIMPHDFKLALLLPHLKKAGLDLLFPNYRPISNLPYVSKVSERSACFQIVDHLQLNGIYEKFQSAYTEGRNCATTSPERYHNGDGQAGSDISHSARYVSRF
jgi:hypothetical protein